MFPIWLYFLAAYGLCFAAQNDKVWWLTDRLKKIPFRVLEDGSTFFDRLLECTFCTGFHAGWMTYLAYVLIEFPSGSPGALAAGGLAWSFCSSAFCYSVDTLTKYLELSTPE